MMRDDSNTGLYWPPSAANAAWSCGLALLVITALLLAACAAPAPPTPIVAPPPTAVPTFTPTVEPGPTVPPTPTATPPPTVTPAPTATVAPTATPIPLAEANYRAALRPAASQGLDLTGMTQYSLTVTLAPDISRVSGREVITYTNRETVTLTSLYLHLYPNLWQAGMTITDVQVAGQAAPVALSAGNSLMETPLAAPLAPGSAITLSLWFSVPIPTRLPEGNYGEFVSQEEMLTLAHFYPTVAVYDTAWRLETPSLLGDVIYHDASLYEVLFTAPAEWIVVATGATIRTVENPDATVTWQLAGGPMRDFNIAASPRYRKLTAQVADVTVNSYFLPEGTIGGHQALTWTVTALQTFEAAFGPYPYLELDVVATPLLAFGVEYPGLIVLRERMYGDPNQEIVFESVTVHEVAHQWWYGIVGNDQVLHPWLDESLSQYSTYLYIRDLYGKEGVEGFINSMENIRWAKVGRIEKPIGLPVPAYTAADYGPIVYGRGALFFLTLAERIGERDMAEFLRRYYARYTWGIATPADFRALAEAVACQDLGDLFREWVYPR